MSDRVLLVDLENVQKIDLSVVPGDTRILIFHGSTQKKLPLTLVKQAQPLGTRLQWIEISGNGPNALDFHIVLSWTRNDALPRFGMHRLLPRHGLRPISAPPRGTGAHMPSSHDTQRSVHRAARHSIDGSL
jgi:hypothetical protein